MIPSLAQWAAGPIDNALAAAGTSASKVGLPALANAGVVYDGLHLVGQGAVLVGIIWGAIAAFVIDHKLRSATVTALIGAALAFVGLINAYDIGFNASPGVTIGYLLLAVIFGAFWLSSSHEQTATLDDELLFVNGTLMRGLALHANLDGAELLEEVATAPRYRLHSIDDDHPAMYEIAEGETGTAVVGELYRIPVEVLLRVIEGEPDGLRRDPVTLADGRVVPGILGARDEVQGYLEITHHGGWRSYMATTALLV